MNAEEDRIDAKLRAGGTPTGAASRICATDTRIGNACGACWPTLYRAGRQAEALRAFIRVRSMLGEDLGLDLSPELARLEEQILLQDPVLEPGVTLPPTNVPVPVSSFIGRVDD